MRQATQAATGFGRTVIRRPKKCRKLSQSADPSYGLITRKVKVRVEI